MTPPKKKGKSVGSNKPPITTRGRSGASKPPRPKVKQTKRRAPRINADTYNRMQKAYFEEQTVRYVSRVAKVSRITAKYYVDGPGQPDAGFTPIKQVWLDIQVEAQERTQLTLIKFREDQLKEAEEIVGTSLAELKLVRAEVFKRVNKYKTSGGKDIETGASLGSALASYTAAVRLVERMLGGADMTLEHRGEDKYRDWSDEEIVELMTTGKVPDHAR